MDEITRAFLFSQAEKSPGKSIFLTHQFLDGTDGRASASFRTTSTVIDW